MSNELVENMQTNETIASLIVGGFINTCNSTFNRQKPIHRQTDEPFEEYLKKEDIENKDVLTIVNSGDFLIHILNNHPKSVSTFDINIFAKYYQDLKIAAILTLNYQEFLDFFYGKNALNEKSFKKVLSILPIEIKNFWESIIKIYDSKTILNSNLFLQKTCSKELAIKYNSYLKNEIEFLKTKENVYLANYAFHNLNYNNLNELVKKFDTIFIGDLLDDLTLCKSLKKVIESMKTCAINNCRENGVVIASTNNKEITKDEKSDTYEAKLFENIKVLKVRK